MTNNINKYKLIYILIIVISMIAISNAWKYTIPPNSILDDLGFRFGNVSITNTSIYADNINTNDSFSYIIYKDDTTTYAKNGTTGLIDYSGTDESDIINNVIISVNTASGTGIYGGSILIKKSEYSDYLINSSINMLDRVDIICEQDAALVAESALSPSLISFNFNTPTTIRSSIKNCRIEGNSLTNYGFVLYNATGRIIIDGNSIAGFLSGSIDLRGGVQETYISNNLIDSPNGGYGIWLRRQSGSSGGTNANHIYNNMITGNSSGAGIYVFGDAIGNTITKNEITSTVKGILIQGDGTTYKPILTVINNNWFEPGGAATQRGIEISDDSGNTIPEMTIIKENHFGNYDIGIYLSKANNTTIEDNFYNILMTTNDINIASGSSLTHIIRGKYTSSGIYNGGTLTSYEHVYGYSPYSFGNSATPPTAFGAGDTYFNTSKGLPCYSNASGIANWNYVFNGTVGC